MTSVMLTDGNGSPLRRGRVHRSTRWVRAAIAVVVLAASCVLVAPRTPAGAVEKGPPPTDASIDGDGPYPTTSTTIPTPVDGFGGGVIHHPIGEPGETFGAIVVAPGFLGSNANYTWMGPRLASHGFVVLLMDTSTRLDLPPSRGEQLLAALDHLVDDSSVASLVDPDRLAVVGHSMGGGGALEAASRLPSLKAAMAFQPWHTRKDWSDVQVPTLIVGAEDDAIAPVGDHAIPFYESLVNAPERAYVELAGTPHSASTTGHPVQARFMVTWLKRFLDDDVRYEPFLCPNPGPTDEISDRRDTCPTGMPSGTPAISGRVTAPDGSPVAGAWIMVFTDANTWVGSWWASTGPDGTYAVHDVPAGTYRLWVGPPAGAGLVAGWYDGAPARALATPVVVEPGAASQVDVELAAGGTVSGTVTGPDGAPAPGVTVRLYADGDGWLGSASTTTADDGTYRIDGVRPGTYRVAFAPPPGSAAVGEWYDDEPTRAAASPVEVEAGAPVEGVDAVLGTSPPPPTTTCAAPPRRTDTTGDAPADAAGLGQLFEQVALPGVNDTVIDAGTGGVATADLDRDGWPDLLAVDEEGALPGALRFYRNDGCWNFERQDIQVLDPEGLPTANHGIPVLADLNGDDLLDLVLTGDPATAGGSHPTLLFLARGDHRTFEEVGEAMGLDDGSSYSRQAALADVDGDGWLDLAVAADQIGDRRFRPGVPWQRLFVYRPPEGGGPFEDGRFEDIGGTDLFPGFGGEPADDPERDRSSPTILLRDLDGDRDVDVVQSSHIDLVLTRWDSPTANDERRHGVHVWRNLLTDTGELRFEPVPPGEGSLAEVGWSTYDPDQGVYVPQQHAVGHPYASSADIDNDGDLDVLTVGPTDLYWHVHTDQVAAKLWVNEGGGHFREATDERGLGPLNWVYDEWFAFFGAGRPPASDLTFTVSCHLSSNQLQRCLDQGPRGLHPYYADTVWADVDNDGWVDLLAVERHEFPWGYGNFRNVLFRNRGDGTFEPTNADWSGIDENSIAAEAVDLNRDGLLDLHLIKDITNTAPLATPGSVPASEFTDSTFWNVGAHGAAQNHWVSVRLTGLPERQLVGSIVYRLDDEGTVIGRRDLFPVTSYKSSVGAEVHFGLGRAPVARLRVEVPGRAPIEVPSVPVDRHVQVDVTTGALTVVGPKVRQLPPAEGG